MSATTVVRPHRRWPVIVGITAVAAIVATFAVLLIAGVFDDAAQAPASTTPVLVVAPSSGGVNQANALREERQLQHGVTASPAAGRFLAQPQGDTKSDIPGPGAAGYEGGN